MKPLFYALLVQEEPTGTFEFAGAFRSREIAEKRGAETGKPFKVESAVL